MVQRRAHNPIKPTFILLNRIVINQNQHRPFSHDGKERFIGISQKALVQPNNRLYTTRAVALRGIGSGRGHALSAGGGVDITTALEIAVYSGGIRRFLSAYGRIVIEIVRSIGGESGREDLKIGKVGGVG